MTTENLIGWGIVGFLGVWWLGWLFTRGMSAARKDRAMKSGSPSGLTIEDKAENRKAFVEGLAASGPSSPGAAGHSAAACATLGAVLVGVGVVVGLVEEGTNEFSSLPLCAGLLLLMLGGALAIGGGK